MAKIDYGAVALIPVGDYSASRQYHANELVGYQGSSYVVLQDPPVGTLPANTTYFMLHTAGTSIATASTPGTVKPDGTSTVVDANGTMSVKPSLVQTIQDTAESATESASKIGNVPTGKTLQSQIDGLEPRVSSSELNLLNLQGNINSEATVRQAADNTLQSNINAEASTRASADSNLQSQINQIVAPSGEAPSAAEVQNARIGADGVTYDTLGNAIRGQVNDIKEDIVNRTANKIATKSNTELQVEKLGHVVTQGLTFNSEIGASISLSVEAGQTIFVSGKSYTSIYPFYMLFNGDTFVSKFSPHEDYKYYEHEKVTIPIGVNRIIVNGAENGNEYPRIYASDTKDLADVENILSNRINDLDTFNFSYIENSYVENGILIDKENFHRTDYINCRDLKILHINATKKSTLCAFFDSNKTYISKFTLESGDNSIDVPVDANYYMISAYKDTDFVIKNANYEKVYQSCFEQFKGKKVVWFGTSIPQGTYVRNGKYISYPIRIGEMLGCTVYNESVGESKVHNFRKKSAITESNPTGITSTDFITSCKTLTNTLEDQEWLIENWQNPQFTSGKYTTMTESQKEEIRGWSYQRKLDKYLTTDTFPDLFVFDHGRNDMWYTPDWTLNENEPYSLYDGSYQSAMNFLIKHILEYNPRAKIAIVGHYSNQVRNALDNINDNPDKVAKGQKEVSEYWQIPILKTWEYTGWCNKTINVNGTDMSVLASWLPDKLHPHSDKSGRAIEHMANVIAPFIRDCLLD